MKWNRKDPKIRNELSTSVIMCICVLVQASAFITADVMKKADSKCTGQSSKLQMKEKYAFSAMMNLVLPIC